VQKKNQVQKEKKRKNEKTTRTVPLTGHMVYPFELWQYYNRCLRYISTCTGAYLHSRPWTTAMAWQTKKLETRNKSITSKAMQYRQDIVTRIRCYTWLM